MANPRIKLARFDDSVLDYVPGYTQEDGEVLLGTAKKKVRIKFDNNNSANGDLIESTYQYGTSADTSAGADAMDGWFSHWNNSREGENLFINILSKHFTFSSTSSGSAKDITFLLEGFGDKYPPTVFPMTTNSRCILVPKSVELYDPLNVIWRVTLTVRVVTGSAVSAIDARMFIVGNGEWKDNDVID